MLLFSYKLNQNLFWLSPYCILLNPVKVTLFWPFMLTPRQWGVAGFCKNNRTRFSPKDQLLIQPT